jgi:hypothetical protein
VICENPRQVQEQFNRRIYEISSAVQRPNPQSADFLAEYNKGEMLTIPVLRPEWLSHRARRQELTQEPVRQAELLREKQLTYQQYEYMTEVMKERIRLLIAMMNQHLMEQRILAESDDDEEVMIAVENTSGALSTNTTQMISSLDPYKNLGGSVEAHHRARN